MLKKTAAVENDTPRNWNQNKIHHPQIAYPIFDRLDQRRFRRSMTSLLMTSHVFVYLFKFLFFPYMVIAGFPIGLSVSTEKVLFVLVYCKMSLSSHYEIITNYQLLSET